MNGSIDYFDHYKLELADAIKRIGGKSASKVPELEMEDLVQQSWLKVFEVRGMWEREPENLPETAGGQLGVLIVAIQRELKDFIKANYWSGCGIPTDDDYEDVTGSGEAPEELAELANSIYQLEQILTDDELQIFKLAHNGYRNSEIARSLRIGHQRVAELRREIGRKGQRRALRGCATNWQIAALGLGALIASGFAQAILEILKRGH